MPKKRGYKFTTHELESLAEAIEDIVPMPLLIGTLFGKPTMKAFRG
jgi:hypothetical protein